MELGNHERETSARDTLWKEKLKPTENGEPTEKTAVKESSFLRFLSREKVPSESGFLRFTFVPSFGRLPSQFHVADATSFLVSVSEEPLEKKNQEIKNTTELVAEGQTIESGPKRKSEASGCTKDNQKNLQPPECKASKRKMDKDDLFQADFVFVTDSDEDKMAMASNGYGHARAHILDTSCTSTSSKSRGNTSKPSDTELSDSSASQQKQCQALNEPESEESSSDTHSEICSPAQLRQQTEELCAAIDEVLQEPLSKQQHDSSPSSLQKLLISDVGKTPITLQRPAGRETRFANLNLRTPTVNESKKTRPGVIRPTTVKAKIIFKKEDPIQPNPFKKYLEETTESQTEQVISHADLLTPGPFSHLGSIFAETYDNSYSPYRHNTLYNKPTHPIVPIPENEALSSKQLHSAGVQSQTDLLVHHENKDGSRGSFADNVLPHSRDPSLLRGDPGDYPAKPN
ncbi:muscular LMNA-interacting protein isoform X5 [Sphaerodactylus townsendi]|uniref:muscular LMNA-interacting protein isoform X5 n=1 Tax=Sphaerodactylus townsendi TaxID=933632 RepID=UPI002026E130|nr:muscular LMNA-interacting protein isoform X5 [Sphaerodactylus townsendi]